MSLCSLFIFFLILLASATGPSRAATVTERNSLWPDGIVFYQYNESITQNLRSTIQMSMDAWEQVSCLKFTPKPSDTTITDYVVFHNHPSHKHCTNSVGRRRGKQDILLGYSCQDFREILHTLGNTIGLYNEQCRPDRDSYVTILTDNIEVGEEPRFAKITDLNVGYQGERYDYASIMHLSAAAYAKGNLVTTEIANVQEYKAQGSPKIGQRLNLSNGNIRQVNRLYNCPAVGQCEKLQISFQDIQGDALTAGQNYHIRVVAVDGNGTKHTLSTDCVTPAEGGTTSALNEVLRFHVNPAKWQFFDVSLLADDSLVSMVETFPLKVGVHPCVHHSIGDQQALVNFTFECIADKNDCAPNPCSLHSTKCDDLLFDYSCICEDGWGGKDCQNDTIDQCLSNPCINGHCVDGHLDYTCFCGHGWRGKNCQIDTINQCQSNPCVGANTQRCVDGHRDYTCVCRPGWTEKNCQTDTINQCLPSPCESDNTLYCIDGQRDYTCECRIGWTGKNCQIDAINDCLSNPCVSDNTENCVDGHRDYTCNCREGYFGRRCQWHKCSYGYCNSNDGTCHPTNLPPYYRCTCPLAWTPSSQCRTWEPRCLQVVIKYARGLKDTDSSGKGKSDPYTVITAYSSDEVTASSRTVRIKGNLNPTWNHAFTAGCNHRWERFWFKLWDSDSGSDDPLSSGQSVYLSSLNQLPSCGHTVNLIGGLGTITFDIFYYTPGGTGLPGSCYVTSSVCAF